MQSEDAKRIASELVTVCVSTFRRSYCAERLIRSVRAFYPWIRVIVADQNGFDPYMDDFYRKFAVQVVNVGFDVGVGAARNACVARAQTPYVLICDDDFIFADDTDLGIPLRIFESDSQVDILGGLVRDLPSDISSDTWTVRRWECFLFRDHRREIMVSSKIDMFTPRVRTADGVPYFESDTLLNWKMLRLSAFQRGAIWDPQFKCNGEHEDFYLNVKERTKLGVFYCPRFTVFHHSPQDFSYGVQRQDQAGWRSFAKK